MKKKGIISLIILFVLLMILGAVFVFLHERDKKISLTQDNVIIEYGNTYNPKIEELIDLSKYNFINLDKVRIESNLENESEKDYPAVGRYQVNVYYRKKILTQEVEVKDTTKPELTVKDSIEIGNGIDLSTFDFKEFITTSDLSQLKDYEVDYSNVDTTKSGEYIAKVHVEDIYSNSIEKEFKIIIPEIVKTEEKETNNEKNVNVGKSNSQKEVTSSVTTKSNSNNNQNNNKTTSKDNSQSTAPSQTTNNTNNGIETSNQTAKKEWCDEGGTKHWQGNGPNEHGYYKTWDEAWEALKSYMKDFESGNYAIRQCPCGLYYFWVVEN